MPDHYTISLSFLTSLAVGLLIGLERERHREAKAGVRTFALISILGTVCAMLGEKTASPWLLVAGLVVSTGGVLAAYLSAPTSTPDQGTTTVMAAALTFCLGAAVWHGYSGIVIAVAIVVTTLLHYKSQLEGFSVKLNATDMESLLQFAVLSLVILPVVPNKGFGPYGALNPYDLWLMVVLISAVSLAGYVAWRLLGGKGPVLLLGALGGLVSSTATTLVYSRGARGKPELEGTAATVILLANLVVLLRLSVLAVAVMPSILPTHGPGDARRARGDAAHRVDDVAQARGGRRPWRTPSSPTRRTCPWRSASAWPTPWSWSRPRGSTTWRASRASTRWRWCPASPTWTRSRSRPSASSATGASRPPGR